MKRKNYRRDRGPTNSLPNFQTHLLSKSDPAKLPCRTGLLCVTTEPTMLPNSQNQTAQAGRTSLPSPFPQIPVKLLMEFKQ